MSSDDVEINVVVEGENSPARATGQRSSSHSEVEETLRARLEAQHLRAAMAARDQIDRASLTVASEAASAKADLKAALETGDFDAAADAQERLADRVAERKRLEEAKVTVARRPAGDPIEAHISQFTARTANWLREHKDWLADPRKNARLTGAHHLAVGEGLTPDTDEYFEHVERTIGLRGGNSGRGGSSGRSGADRRPINPSDINSHISNSGKSVYLTEGERQRATDGTLVWNFGPNRGKPIGIQEMARRKAELHKQGAYNRLD